MSENLIVMPNGSTPETSAPGPNERRLGRFRISHVMFENDDWVNLKALFANVVPVRAESLFAPPCIEYTALSSSFDYIDIQTEEPPLYDVRLVSHDDGTVTMTFRKPDED